VYRLHTVVAEHHKSDIKQKWENSKWQREVTQKPSRTHLYGMITSSAGLSELSSSGQLSKTESPCTVFEIQRFICQNTQIFLPHMYLTPPLGVTPLKFHQDPLRHKTRVPVNPDRLLVVLT